MSIGQPQPAGRSSDVWQLQVHLKFWQKPKDDLKNGNVAQRFIDYANPEAALAFINQIYDHQDELNEQPVADVADYLTTKYGVHESKTAEVAAQEAQDNGLVSVPSVVLGDTAYADDTLKNVDELIS
ncbi:hypothetical protein B8W96_01010 [Lentilactobacillus parakefiri]|uniref:thioredoxin domain-containing protein n=1 Tax=Lentilactobacillus parakefiri TaxID=152332 RepID=UPI000BA7BDF7|nr:thioredoxin domain-containing protein [Lentilactobacillus parakefiri]PAL01526.1 hypothetical protein B8W96_01010 [Lentilactobacillus parakefiri]